MSRYSVSLLGEVQIAGLARGATRYLPPSDAVPRAGRVIGTSNYPGGERPIAVSYEEAVRHSYVVGQSGQGTTTALANWALQDITAGCGVVLMESKGDLSRPCLTASPHTASTT